MYLWVVAPPAQLVFMPTATQRDGNASRVPSRFATFRGAMILTTSFSDLHNLIFAFLIRGAGDTKYLNTLTGLSVAFLFSGTVFAVAYCEMLVVRSPDWFFVFLFLCALYSVA